MRRLAVFAAGLAAAIGLWAAAPAAPAQPVGLAKTCSSGFTHAVIGGAQKCLRAGEYCAHRYDRQYQRYGYRCIRRDAYGRYHLTRK